MRKYWMGLGALALLPLQLSAQGNALAAADSALELCVAAAQLRNEPAADAAGDRATALYGDALKNPATEASALTGRARVISQCRIPFAPFMRQGELVEESIALLQQALQIDSTSFGARFILAMNYFSMPEFLGKTGDAVEQFERLLALHGNRKEVGAVATAYRYLGDLYLRGKNLERARQTWKKGLELFPDDVHLSERLASARDVSSTSPPIMESSRTSVNPGTTPAAAETPRFTFKPLVVEAGSYSVEDPRSATALKRMDIYMAPGGAADVLQVFQMMPGATRATDGSDLYVRGGDPAESPVYLDGARLFHPGTFESLDGSVFGVLDPAVLKNAYFSAGGFSARYGNALSGVLDVETDGRPDAMHWRAFANLTTAGGTLHAPIGPKLGAFVSTSVTETSALLRTHGRSDEYGTAPRALQGIGSLVYAPRAGTQVRLVGLSQADNMEMPIDAFGYAGDLRATGATRVAALASRWLHPSTKYGARASASISQRETGFRFGVLDRARNDRGYNLKVDADYAPSLRIHIRAGAEAAHLRAIETGAVPTSEDLTPGAPVERLAETARATDHIGGYLETELRLTSDLALITGARADRLPGEDEVSFDPRIALALRAGEWTLRAGAGVYHQGRWRVRYQIPDAGLPLDIPTRSEHFALGAQHGTSFRAEAYRKQYDAYIRNGSGPEVVSGTNQGIDLLYRWTALDRVSGWISYSLLDATLELASGRRVRSPNDVTHTITGVARASVADHWDVGSTLRFGTGRPFTPILGGSASATGRGYDPVYGAITAERLPAYVRIDTRIMRLQPIGGRMIVCYLEALNVLDHANVLSYTYDGSYQHRRSVESFFSDRTLVFGVEAQF